MSETAARTPDKYYRPLWGLDDNPDISPYERNFRAMQIPQPEEDAMPETSAANCGPGDSLLLADVVDEEVAEYLAEEGLDLPWVPSLADEEQVEKYLRALRYYQDQADVVEARADAAVKRAEEFRAGEGRKAAGAIAYLTARLKQHSEATGRGKRVSPYGTLQWRKGRERVEIDDEAGFCDLHSETDLVRTKHTPAKDKIKAQIKSTGEIPAGADIVRSEDTFAVTLTPKE